MIGTPLAVIGAAALWLLFAWLFSAIIAGYLSERKGYGEKPGLATALLFFVIGPLVWLVWPARPESAWKREGPFPRRRSA